MGIGKSIEKGLIFGITILVIISSFTPMATGFNGITLKKEIVVEDHNLDIYNLSEISSYEQQFHEEYSSYDTSSTEKIVGTPSLMLEGLMDSPWPMYCHDVRHTGRSPYNTTDNPGEEKWRFKDVNGFIRGSPVIGNDGTIYFGGSGNFYALYPNGTLKWKYEDLKGYVQSAPAIDEDGTIYFGLAMAWPYYFYALYPDGTLKWKYPTENVYSSPAIAEDGTIYFGDESEHIYAMYPNGTLRWKYKTGHVVYSSPAIGEDDTVYCGSHDTYLYALYPNNGTLKWRYKTGHWIRVSPCIADDGTIYVVSLDNHLHAIHPNGTLKWKTNMGEGGASPTIDQDGTIYAGYKKLHAINPVNGSVKWTLDAGGKIKGATPCNSVDGFIYFGTEIGDYGGGDIVAVNPNGTERWRKRIANMYVESAPAIGIDGTIYIGSACMEDGNTLGYLYSFGIGELEADANGPYYGLINEPVQFNGSSKGGYSPHSYHWDFGDGNTSDEQNHTHTYTYPGNFTITLTVTDDSGNTSDDTTWAWIQESNDPPNKPSITGEINGKVGTKYDYTFVTNDPEGLKIWYYIEWGDGTDTGWIGSFTSGTEITKSHSWSKKDTYTVRCRTKDPYGDESEWGELEVTMPKNQQQSIINWRFLQFLQNHPRMFLILRLLLGPT